MATRGDADRYLDVKLELVCQHCGSAGLIPLERLDRVLFCSGCLRLFRVEAAGLVEIEPPADERISVQVRSSSSQWHVHRAVIEKETTFAERLRERAVALAASNIARAAAVCGLIGLIVGVIALAPAEPGPPPSRELPVALKERAALLTEALALRDMEILIGLTDPSQHRALRIWLAHGSDLPKKVSAEHAPVEAEVLSTAKTTPGGDSVDVRVRLRTSGDGKKFVLDERWVRQGEAWYFRPVRLRAPPQPIVWPAGTQRKRPVR